MKRAILTAFAALVFVSFNTYAFDLKGALKSAAASAAQSDSTKSSSTSNLGSLLGGIGNLLGITDVTIKDLVGTWKYNKPAIAFQSDNFLKKAGGEAAASVIEQKLLPYYQKAGITAMVLTVNADSTFVMKLNKITLKGVLEKDSKDNFVFNFQAFNSIKIGRMTSVISKAGNNIDVTFDASKLLTLITKISAITGNSTLGTVSSLLNSYDGMNAGFQLTKQ